MTGGVYVIRRLATDEIYVGSSRNIPTRWGQHRSDLRCGRHSSAHLQGAWNKDGESGFSYSVLEPCAFSELAAREQYYLDTLRPQLNIKQHAVGPIGKDWSASARARMSTAQKVRHARDGISPETSRRRSASLKIAWAGKPRPWLRGRKQSAAEIEARIAPQRGKPCLVKRKPKSAETRRRMSAAAMGNTKGAFPKSAATRARISAALVGRTFDVGRRQRLALAHLKCRSRGLSLLRTRDVGEWETEFTYASRHSSFSQRHTCSDTCREKALTV